MANWPLKQEKRRSAELEARNAILKREVKYLAWQLKDLESRTQRSRQVPPSSWMAENYGP